MRLYNIAAMKGFFDIVQQTTGAVWLEDFEGNRINLKSKMSQYIALDKMISEEGDQLELFCQDTNDEGLFYEFFQKYPESL